MFCRFMRVFYAVIESKVYRCEDFCQARCDEMRLDKVKHVFGAASLGADKKWDIKLKLELLSGAQVIQFLIKVYCPELYLQDVVGSG